MPDADEWQVAVQRMQRAGFTPISPVNPYWEPCGRTFEDPDGRRIVLQNASWPAAENDAIEHLTQR